ncbi:branched-chain amino acid ABC transporter permease [Halomonas sp. HAL1]|uniref:branched-chain amino acid ABC transporter permease n=1 Tax=Halomonas sp. HAL1 TaxID=550984 RepID=UPI00022D303B|nr:branched-chain amino acid ABC transporter permease [Halomonas sp. HAL1]EHA13640.1 inner-membrane translocator [Halomonas sp. HAL1]WKV91618.1 branched-chain amino acid ABC transporter permease [Halomonas sp. HAL1]
MTYKAKIKTADLTIKKPRVNSLWVLLGVYIVSVVAVVYFTSQHFHSSLVQALIIALMATSVGFLVKQSGLVSFGHALFFGFSAYAIAILTQRFGFSIEIAIVLSIALSILLGLICGFVFIRGIGIAFAMLTLATAQAFHEVALRWRELANGEDGMFINLPESIFGMDSSLLYNPTVMLLITSSVLAAVIVTLTLFSRSKYGLLTMAVRDNEERVRYIGHSAILPRVLIYVISAAISSLGGVLFALYNTFVSPEILHWSFSGEALIMAIIGGVGFIWGPALGAVAFYFLKEMVMGYTAYWAFFMGVLLILVTVVFPGGVAGVMHALYSKCYKIIKTWSNNEQ